MGDTFNINPSSFHIDFLRSSHAGFYLKLHCDKKILAVEKKGHTSTQGLHKQ
jgi:hypothetical protein